MMVISVEWTSDAAYSGQAAGSRNPKSLRRLTREEQSLDQFPLAADRHPGEMFVPHPLGDLRFAVEPLRQ